MTCDEMRKLDGITSLKLMGGERGLSRTIRWLYFVDASTSLRDIESLGKWVSGGELFICVNETMMANQALIIETMRSADFYRASGIILNIDSVTPEMVSLADELEIPLFELPWSIRTIDLSQIICTKLVREQTRAASLDMLLSNLLYNELPPDWEPAAIGAQLDFDFSAKNRVAVFICKNKDSAEAHTFTHFSIIVQNAFSEAGLHRIPIVQGADSIIVIFQDKSITKEKFMSVAARVEKECEKLYSGAVFHATVGNSHSGIQKIRKSYKEAQKALQLMPVASGGLCVFFEDMGIYTLLFGGDDRESFERFCLAQLGNLIEYDRINGTQLCLTLETYLQNNKNVNTSAESLFIHRNTLRYRLEKIRGILGKDFETIENAINYTIAFKTLKYLQQPAN